jgi:transcription elongation factor Elf1
MKNPRCPKCNHDKIQIILKETRSYGLRSVNLNNGDIELDKDFSPKIVDEGLAEIRCGACGAWWETYDGLIESIRKSPHLIGIIQELGTRNEEMS